MVADQAAGESGLIGERLVFERDFVIGFEAPNAPFAADATRDIPTVGFGEFDCLLLGHFRVPCDLMIWSVR